jgi:hypothetical protein
MNERIRPDLNRTPSRDYGVDGDDLTWMSLERLVNALTLAARVTGDRFFGLKHGSRGRFTSNPLGYLLTNAPVLATNHLEFVEGTGMGRVEFSYPVTMSNVSR